MDMSIINNLKQKLAISPIFQRADELQRNLDFDFLKLREEHHVKEIDKWESTPPEYRSQVSVRMEAQRNAYEDLFCVLRTGPAIADYLRKEFTKNH